MEKDNRKFTLEISASESTGKATITKRWEDGNMVSAIVDVNRAGHVQIPDEKKFIHVARTIPNSNRDPEFRQVNFLNLCYRPKSGE